MLRNIEIHCIIASIKNGVNLVEAECGVWSVEFKLNILNSQFCK